MNNSIFLRQVVERQGDLSRQYNPGFRMLRTAKTGLLATVIMTVSFDAWASNSEISERLDDNQNVSRWTQGEPLFSGLGRDLEAAGITPHLSLWSLWVGNPSTGPRKGSHAVTNNIFAGADFDLERMLSIPDAAFHLEYTFFPGNQNVGQPTGPAYAGAAGSYFGGSPARNDISGGYLSQFSYEQDYFEGRLKAVVGRTNARRYFFENNCSSVVACNDPIWDNATGSLPPPYASWGAFGQLQIGNHKSLKLGVFESDPQQYLDEGHGFDWNPSDSAGESILAAIGHETTFSEDAYPGRYELIGFYNTSDQFDPRTGELDGSGTAGVMFKFRQALWRPDGGIRGIKDPESLLWFGSVEAAPGDNQPYQGFVETGLTYLNPFDRPADMANVKVSYARLGSRQLEAQRDARMANGGSADTGSRHVYRIETNYHLGLPGYIFLEPSVQYVINPSNFYNPSARHLNDDGLVVALQFGINLGKAMGLTPSD
ncbi:carbohydrate porin [Chromohalobacter israelensis]|uniref:carbohydrate porin n=1 Tax=Chromohalobacter israelensis TaxID=141390 RepID=UPI0015C44ACB|nr:carbohydrate porin [Chromohalobacter salexigens]NWO55141.1 porin [Chromohalobacter salexigens]